MSGKQSNVIDILKGILPLLVVAIHTSLAADLCYRDGLSSFLRVLTVDFGAIAVPSFFFISGLLFFTGLQKWDWHIWEKKVTGRARTLLLPFVLWIVIDFAAKFVWGVLKHQLPGFGFASLCDFFTGRGALRMFYDRPLVECAESILGYAVDCSKPIDGPLWYVRELIVLVLLAPLIWKVIKATRYYAVALFGVLYLLYVGLPFVLISPTALFFFSAGASFAISGKDFLDCFRKFRIPAIVLSIVFLALKIVTADPLPGDLSGRCFVISGVVMIFNIAADSYDAGRIRPVKLLTESSFFIYASHSVLITEISNFLLWRALPVTAEWMLVLKVFLRPAVAVGICLLIFVTMKKCCPKTLAVLTGGRG